MASLKRRSGLGRVGFWALLIFILLIFMSPFLWMLLNSLKTPIQIITLPPSFWFKPTLSNYSNVFEQQEFGKFFINSLAIGVGSTFFGLLLGLPAAYAIARYNQGRLATLILLARMIPGISLLIPWFIMFRALHLTDTYLALILTHMLVGVPFIVWVMIPFFEAIPKELDEAGRVDGGSTLQVFLHVILPISGPGIVTASIMAFIYSWNNFMFSVVLAANNTKTLPVAIYNFISYAQIDWGGLMAAAVVITLPVLIIAILTQRFIVAGLTAGAVKG
ncbi:MAG: carbohydrate ABC transporter permease [Firmicutes bacterium]|nr:carbohydrate ABC transporter permease [Bacillota bacterium]